MKNDMEYNTGLDNVTPPDEYLQSTSQDEYLQNMPPDEYRQSTSPDEYLQSLPPDEYLQGGGSQTADGKRRKATWKKMMYMAAALAIMAYTAAGAYDWDSYEPDAVQIPDSSDAMNVTGVTTSPEQTDSPLSTKEPEASTETAANQQTTNQEENEVAVLPYYPMEDMTSIYTVYNDTVDPDNNWNNRVLEEGFLFEALLAQGMDYPLPAYEPAEGYEFLGWIIYYDKAAKPPTMAMAGDALTAGNVGYIKPEGGSRPIEVHAAWRSDGISEYPYLLTLDANGGTIENETSVSYDAKGPMGSETYVYLCAYPTPVRDGYTFTGWYTEPGGGDRKTRLMGLDFYPKQGDEYDWSKTITITLYAGWAKN